jgi:hypothetical protein
VYVTSCLDFSIGFTRIYLSSVARAADSIDRNSTIPMTGAPPPSPTNPGLRMARTDFGRVSIWEWGFTGSDRHA